MMKFKKVVFLKIISICVGICFLSNTRTYSAPTLRPNSMFNAINNKERRKSPEFLTQGLVSNRTLSSQELRKSLTISGVLKHLERGLDRHSHLFYNPEHIELIRQFFILPDEDVFKVNEISDILISLLEVSHKPDVDFEFGIACLTFAQEIVFYMHKANLYTPSLNYTQEARLRKIIKHFVAEIAKTKAGVEVELEIAAWLAYFIFYDELRQIAVDISLEEGINRTKELYSRHRIVIKDNSQYSPEHLMDMLKGVLQDFNKSEISVEILFKEKKEENRDYIFICWSDIFLLVGYGEAEEEDIRWEDLEAAKTIQRLLSNEERIIVITKGLDDNVWEFSDELTSVSIHTHLQDKDKTHLSPSPLDRGHVKDKVNYISSRKVVDVAEKDVGDNTNERLLTPLMKWIYRTLGREI